MKSIMAQTYTNYEVIFIDDGSTDGTLQKINTFCELCENLKVISIKHNGVAYARNYAINIAKGDWITFVDVDDYIDKDYLKFASLILDKHLGIEMIQSNMIVESREKKYHYSKINNDVSIDKEDIINSIISQNISKKKFFGNIRCIGGKFYKKDVIKDLSFPCDLVCFEDGIFNLYAVNKAKKIYFDDSALYHYVMNETSATHKINSMQTQQNDLILEKIEKFCKDNNFNNDSCALCCFEQFKVDLKNVYRRNLKNYKGFKVEVCRLYLKYEKYWNILESKMIDYLNSKDRMIFYILRKRIYIVLYFLYRIKGRD